MLAAVLHGKAARITVDGKDVSWRELFRQREDLLTAAFFGRFLYLSLAVRQEALALLVGSRAAVTLGDIEEILFWPSLHLSDGKGGRRVEPDVIILCEKALIMVEVKPPWGQQAEVQWLSEVKALVEIARSKADIGFDIPDMVHFVALGKNSGLNIHNVFAGFATSDFFDFEPHQKEWGDILKRLDGWTQPQEDGDRAVIADWRSVFELFGIRRPIKSLANSCKLPPVLEESLSLLVKMRTEPVGNRASRELPLPWRPLFSLSSTYILENSQCTSLLKKLALS